MKCLCHNFGWHNEKLLNNIGVLCHFQKSQENRRFTQQKKNAALLTTFTYLVYMYKVYRQIGFSRFPCRIKDFSLVRIVYFN